MSKEIAPDRTPGFDPIAEADRQWRAHGWAEAATGMAAVTTIVRVNQLLVARVEQSLAPLGLTFARFEILRLLGFSRKGRLPMGKIGDRLQVHPASVTSAVKRLERDGLIRRLSDRNDSRVVLAVLLARGRRLADEATMRVNEVFTGLGIEESELKELIAILNRLRAAAGDPVRFPEHETANTD